MVAIAKTAKESATDDLFQSIARHLLWTHLTHGRCIATVVMTNQDRCIDGMRIQVLIPARSKFASWTVYLADPDFGAWHSLNSRIFYPALFTWPKEPSWREFSFGRVWANPCEPADDYQFEELVMGDSPGEWPSLIEGAGYHYWAMVGMAKRGHIDDRDLSEFFRAQDGLPQIGDVELLAVGGESESKWTFPFEEDSVINLLSVLRQEWSQAQAQSTWRDDPGNARFLVEPWLMVSPAVPHGILEFITSDPACPAVTLAAKYAELPVHLKKIIKRGERGSIPDVWELKGNASDSSRLKPQKKKSATKSDLVGATDPAAASLRDEVNVLLNRILEVVPHPTEDADEDSLEGLVGRHMQFLQATDWMPGAVEMPARTIRAWRSALATLAEALEVGDDDAVAEAAYNSWSKFGK